MIISKKGTQSIAKTNPEFIRKSGHNSVTTER